MTITSYFTYIINFRLRCLPCYEYRMCVQLNYLPSHWGASVQLVSCYMWDGQKRAVETKQNVAASWSCFLKPLIMMYQIWAYFEIKSLEYFSLSCKFFFEHETCNRHTYSVHQLADSDSVPAESIIWAVSVHWHHLVPEPSLALVHLSRSPGSAGRHTVCYVYFCLA